MIDFKRNKSIFLIKLFSINSLGVLLRTIFGLVSQKLVAVFIGPSGIALLGNLRNAIALISLVSTSGIDQGVVKFQSEYENDSNKLNQLYATSKIYALIGSIVVFLVLVPSASFWSNYLFSTSEYNYLFIVLAFALPFTALYNICFSIVNGRSNYMKATFMVVTTHALVAIILMVLVIIYKESGALLALVLTPVIQFIVLLIYAKSEINLLYQAALKWDRFFSKQLSLFIVMAFAAVVLNNVVELNLRNYLIEKISLDEAGYWTSMLSVSNYYLAILAGFYSLYVLPRYAKINSFNEFKLELIQIYKIILPIFLMLFILIYLLRIMVIQLLFTEEFIGMESLFKWQLIGDFIKIIAVIMAYILIAKQQWKLFIISEAFSSLLFYVLGIYFVERRGAEGLVIANLLRYLGYLFLIFITLKVTFKPLKSN